MGIHDDMSVRIASGATDNLEEGSFRAEESDFLSIEDPDERRLRKVESFSEKIHSYDHVDNTQSIISENLESFDGFDF